MTGEGQGRIHRTGERQGRSHGTEGRGHCGRAALRPTWRVLIYEIHKYSSVRTTFVNISGQGRDRGGVTGQGRDRGGVTEQGRDRGGVTGQGRDRGGVTGQGRDRGGVTGQGRDRGGVTGQGRGQGRSHMTGEGQGRIHRTGEGQGRSHGTEGRGHCGRAALRPTWRVLIYEIHKYSSVRTTFVNISFFLKQNITFGGMALFWDLLVLPRGKP